MGSQGHDHYPNISKSKNNINYTITLHICKAAECLLLLQYYTNASFFGRKSFPLASIFYT